MLSKNQTIAVIFGTMLAAPAFAADPAPAIQRDVNQQQRIEQGLKSGALNTQEAARLEKGEARINSMEQKALSDGKLSTGEKARIQRAQNAESHAIYNEKHDAQKGNPASASSQRMQADVQRNIYQEKRIAQGVQSGALTNKEAAQLEGGQARVTRNEARAGADGHVGAGEQRRIQNAENHQSKRIYNKKHN
jgi:hypothetical protein